MKTPEDFAVLDVMQRYGGNFMRALAELGFRSDAENLAKIKATWPEYWAESSKIAARLAAQEKATAAEGAR